MCYRANGEDDPWGTLLTSSHLVAEDSFSSN